MLWVSPKATCADGYPPGEPLGAARPPGARPAQAGRRRRVPARASAGWSRSASTASRATAATRSTCSGVSPALTNEYPLLFARAVIGRAAARARRRSSARRRWARRRSCPGSGQATSRERLRRPAARDRLGADRGDERLPDLGLGRRRLLAPPGARRRALRPLGAARRVSPVMEVGGAGPNATPWALGADGDGGLRDAAVLHYELFPYLYGLLAGHEPVLRPLAYGYPRRPARVGSTLELLVGPDLSPRRSSARGPRRASTCRRARGSTSTPARRSREAARPSRARRRSTSSRSTCGPGR